MQELSDLHQFMKARLHLIITLKHHFQDETMMKSNSNCDKWKKSLVVSQAAQLRKSL